MLVANGSEPLLAKAVIYDCRIDERQLGSQQVAIL